MAVRFESGTRVYPSPPEHFKYPGAAEPTQSRIMTSPAGPQSHFLWRWMASSSRTGVFLSGSPGEVGSVRSSCSSPGVEVSLEDSFSEQFAPLPMSRSSSCVSMDSICPSQSSRAPGSIPPSGALGSIPPSVALGSIPPSVALGSIPPSGAQGSTPPSGAPGSTPPSGAPGSTPPSSEVDMGRPSPRNPQGLIERLQELKQLQQRMQEQLKAHQQEQLQKLQNEQSRLSGMVPSATAAFDTIKQPCGNITEQPEPPGSQSSHTRPRVSPVQHEHQQPKEVEMTLEPSMWIQEPGVDQTGSGHHSDEVYDHEEEWLHPEDKSMCGTGRETEPHDRPIRSGGSGKTFEEILEEQLKLENEKQSKISDDHTDEKKVKRPFLRRGEGLARFTRGKTTRLFRDRATSSDTKPTPSMNPPAIQGTTTRTHQSSEPKRTSPKSISTTNIVTQRKTAVLNKNNFRQKTTLPVTKSFAKAHVHEGHQNFRVERQNVSSGPVQYQGKSDNKPEGQKFLTDIMVDINKGASRQFHCMDEQSARIAENSFEVWLKERGEHWEKDKHRECVELGEFELLERAADEFSFSSNSSFINTLLRRDGRRLSSTPVKSPPKSSFPDRCLDNGTGQSKAHSPPLLPPANSVAVMGGANTQLDEGMTECSEDDEMEESDTSLCSNTVFHKPAIVPNLQDAFNFQVSAPPYDKQSYQDRDGAGSPEGEDESQRDSTLVGARGQVEFDDDDTWNEPESSSSSPGKMGDQPGRVLMRKTAVSKGAELDRCSNSSPPTCQLVAKLFPALKPKPCPPPPELPDSDGNSEQGGGRSTLLRERLVELETELERFRKENAALSRLKQENQAFQENLRKERAEFQRNMADELAKWEEFKHEEGRKLQREKKLFEKHAAAARARPDKQERDEIQSLKQQLNTLQEDLRKREARWTSTHSRLRQQIDTLSAENATLRDQVRTLEKLRLSTLKNAETGNGEQEKERGQSGASSNSGNKRTTKSKGPSSSMKSSPPENSKKVESLGVQNPPRIPSRFSSTTFSTDRQKDVNPVTDPHHISDHLIVSEVKRHDPQPIKNSTRSVLEVDSPSDITGKSELEQEEITHMDGKIEKMLPDGGRLTVFPNGTRKEVSADGLSVRVTFFNGDTKQIMPNQTVIYYYAEAQTTHTTYPDGMEVLQFPNNQIEKHFIDGHKEIIFPDQTIKNLYPDGTEESVLIDGTIIQQNPDGTKQIQFNTGQRELHTAEFKRREYPDGTVKTVYSDGRQETRYPTGRVRLKNPEGHVIMDKA